jgi:hypothetical protein
MYTLSLGDIMAKVKSFNYFLNKRYDLMMGRCYRKSDKSHKSYGARGIKVCSDWIKDINNFKIWFTNELSKSNISKEEFMLNSKVYQLDRIDTNGHYSPLNCRIVNPQTNTRNRTKSKNRIIESAEGELFNFNENNLNKEKK